MCGAQVCGAMWCQYVVPNVWCQMCGANMCGAKCVVPNVWCQICGAKCVVPICVVPVGAPGAMWCQLEQVISSDFPEISRDLGNSRDLMTSQRSKGQGQGQGRLI